MAKNKVKRWSHFRHQLLVFLAHIVCLPFYPWKYNFRYKKFRPFNRPYLIISNHQTKLDQFILSYMFNGNAYFVFSDDMASIKFWSPLLHWSCAPIPYKKSSTDFGILKTCRKVASEGKSIIIFVEGNTTYSGKTEYINPTIAKMIKFLKLPVIFTNVTGGYGKMPRWGQKQRKGTFNCAVKKIYEFSELENLTDDEVYQIVLDNTFVDESNDGIEYPSKHGAEYLERVLYRCPKCGLTHFYSEGNTVKCLSCNETYTYNANKTFSENAPFRTVNEWYEYQKQTLLNDSIKDYGNDHLFFSDELVRVTKTIPRERKEILCKEATISLYANRLEAKGEGFELTIYNDDINSAYVAGKNKLCIRTENLTYQFKNLRLNSLKYLQFIYKYKIENGEIKDNFLGL